MLCVASCSSVSRPSLQAPADSQQTGNAYRLLLPAGTTIVPADERSRREIAAIAYNELVPTARDLEMARPLQLVSPAYIAQRNATELQLLKVIAELKEENARLRAGR